MFALVPTFLLIKVKREALKINCKSITGVIFSKIKGYLDLDCGKYLVRLCVKSPFGYYYKQTSAKHQSVMKAPDVGGPTGGLSFKGHSQKQQHA